MKPLITAAVAATAFALVSVAGPAAGATENSWQSAFAKCGNGSEDWYAPSGGNVAKKSFKGGAGIGTLYIVEMRDNDSHRVSGHCAVTIKGGDTSSKHHYMEGEIKEGLGDIADNGFGYRKAFLGPFYAPGDFYRAESGIYLKRTETWKFAVVHHADVD